MSWGSMGGDMKIEYSAYLIVLAFSCIITTSLGLVALYRRVNKGAVAFAGLMFGAALFSFCDLFVVSSLSVFKAYFWLKASYVGNLVIPVFWFIMIRQYTGVKDELTNTKICYLFIIPSVSLLLLMASPYQELFYSNPILERHGSISILVFEKGPWYWVHLIYSCTLIFITYFQLIKAWLYSDKRYRNRLGIFAAGAIAPFVANLLYHVRITPKVVDLSPASYAIAGLFFAWGIYRYGVFDIIPIARNNVFETIRDGVIVLDLHNRVVDYNLEAKSTMKNIGNLEIGQLFDKELKNYFKIKNTAAHDSCVQRDIKITGGNETVYYDCILSPVLDKKKSILGKTIILRNVTDQMKLREHLRILATLDGLTNIYNRRYFLELGCRTLEKTRSKAQPVAVVLFDIDMFKNINDTYGHDAGDRVLCRVAKACAVSLRSTDIYARYGGEEFICLLPNINSKAAIKIAERIRKNIANMQLDFLENTIRITASFGVAGTDSTENISLDKLIKMADKALYDAKSKGRNCTSCYESS